MSTIFERSAAVITRIHAATEARNSAKDMAIAMRVAGLQKTVPSFTWVESPATTQMRLQYTAAV